MMVDEISNKTLAVLLIVAIALSLGGTLVSLNRLSSVVRGPSITGFASSSSSSGSTNVTILTTASLRFSLNNLDFGIGLVNTSGGNQVCTMASGDPTGVKDASDKCVNFTAAADLDNLELENDGNLNLSVNFTSDADAAEFLGGPSGLQKFMFKVAANGSETGACGIIGTPNWVDITTGVNMPICNATGTNTGGLGFAPLQNSIDLLINITIPSDSLRVGSNMRVNLTAIGTTLV